MIKYILLICGILMMITGVWAGGNIESRKGELLSFLAPIGALLALAALTEIMVPGFFSPILP